MEGSSLGSLFLHFAADTKDLERSLGDIQKKAVATAQSIEKAMGGIGKKGLTLTPKVDHTELYALNKHLDLKEKHFKDVQGYFTRNPLNPKVETSGLDQLNQKFALVERSRRKLNQARGVQDSVGTSEINRGQERTEKLEVGVDTSGIETAINSIGKTSALSKIGDNLSAPFRAIGGIASKVVTGALEGVGRPIGDDIGQGIKEGIQRESGDIVGSFRLISREIGAEVSKGIIESLGDDAVAIKSVFEGVIGKDVVAIEAASQRQQASQQRNITKRQAGQQIQKEFEFVRDNLPALKDRGQALKAQRQDLIQKQQTLQAKVTEAADAMGVKQLQQRLDQLKEERNQVIEQMTGTNDPASAELYRQQLERLSERYNNTEFSIESINKSAANRFRGLADQLTEKSDELLIQERAFGKIMSPIDNIDFVETTKSIKQKKKSTTTASANLPETYRQIAQEVAKASGINFSVSSLPGLVANASMPKNSFGTYLPESNQIEVPPEMLEAVNTGNLTAKQIETLVHELRHGVQFGLGQGDVQSIRSGVTNPQVELLRPVAEELKQFRRNIEGSVKEQSPQYQGTARQLETDAYTFATRNAPAIQAKVLQSARVAKFEQSQGIGGAKAETLFKQSQLQALKKLQGIQQMIPDLGLDEGSIKELEANFTQTLNSIYGLDNHLEKVLSEAANIELLPVNQIDALEQNLLTQVAELSQVANRHTQNFFDRIKSVKDKQSKPKSTEPQQGESEGLSFNETLKEQYTAKGLREVAGKLNIGGMGSASKDALATAIAVAREHNQKQVDAVINTLGDSIRKKSSATGTAKSMPKLEDFAGIKETLQATDRDIRQAMEMLVTAQGEERKELLEAIVGEIDKQVAWIDSLTNNFDVTGKEKQSLTGYRNLFANSRGKPNAELIDIRNTEIAKLSNKGGVSGGYVQGVSTMRGNSFDSGGYRSVADVQDEIDKLFKSAMGGYQEDTSAYHSVKDIQEEIENLVNGVLLQFRRNTSNPQSVEQIEARQAVSESEAPGAIPLPDGDEAGIVVQARNNIDKFEQAQNQINQRFQSSSQEVEETLGRLGSESETLTSRLIRVFKAFQSGGLFEGFRTAKENIGGLIKALLGLNALRTAVSLFQQIAPVLIDAAIAMESLERRVNFVSGNFAAGAENMAYLREEASRLGIDLRQAAEGYIGLAAATKDTALEGTATKQVSSAVNQAAAVYGLDTQSTERAYTAFSQIASKGKLQSEELRGQLSESLPGAFQVAARAMGVTTQELGKMLEQGQVLSEDFLPKFAQQLSAETSSGVAGAAGSSMSALNNFNNAVFETQAALGKGLLPARNFGLEVMANGLKLVQENAGLLITIAKFLATVLGVNAVKSVWAMTTGLRAMLISSIATQGGLAGVAMAAKGMLLAAGPMLLQFLAFAAIAGTIDKIRFAFSDAGGTVRQFADRSKAGLKEFRESLAEARGETQKFNEEKEKIGFFGKVKQGLDGLDNSVGGFFEKIGMKPVGDFFKTKEKKTLDDSSRATDELISGSKATVGASQSADVKSIVGEINTIDKKLKEVQMKRRALVANSPSDVEGLKKLKAEEEQLLKDREGKYKPVGQLSAQFQAEIDGLKKGIEEYEAIASDSKVSKGTRDEYSRKAGELKTQLDAAEKAQHNFNSSVGEGVNGLKLLARQFQDISDRLADINSKSQLQGNLLKAQTASKRANGVTTQGQDQAINQAIEQQLIDSQFQQQLIALKEQKALLDTDENRQIMQSYGVTEETGATGFKTLAERAAEGTPERALFERQASVKEQEGQVADLANQLEQKKADTRRQLEEVSRSVVEYYRGIDRQSQELALTAQQQAKAIATTEAKTKLKSAVAGLQDNFVGQFIDSIIGIMESLDQPFEEGLKAQQEALKNQFQYEDTYRQGTELRKQLPGENGLSQQDAQQGLLPALSVTGGSGGYVEIAASANQANQAIASLNAGLQENQTQLQQTSQNVTSTGTSLDTLQAKVSQSANVPQTDTLVEKAVGSQKQIQQKATTFDSLFAQIRANWQDTSASDSFWDSVQIEAGNVGMAFQTLGSGIGQMWNQSMASAGAFFNDTNAKLGNTIKSSDLWNGAVLTVAASLGIPPVLALQFANAMSGKVDPAMQGVNKSIGGSHPLLKSMSGFTQGIQKEARKLSGIFAYNVPVLGKIGEFMNGLINKAKEWGQHLAHGVSQAGQAIANSPVGQAVGGAWEATKGWVGDRVNDVKGLFSPQANDAGAKVAQQALKWVGKDFKKGVFARCADFVRSVLGQASFDQSEVGISKKPIDAGTQPNNGALMARSFFGNDIGQVFHDPKQARPGDIIGFRGTYGEFKGTQAISHVGVYTGNGMMVDRSTSSQPVRERSIDTFGKGNYVFVRPYAYGEGDGSKNNQMAALNISADSNAGTSGTSRAAIQPSASNSRFTMPLPTGGNLRSGAGQNVPNWMPKMNWEQHKQFLVNQAMATGITDPNQIKYLLATAEHETGKGTFMREGGSSKYLSYLNNRLGNKGNADAVAYRGAGYSQLTGKSNFEKWSPIVSQHFGQNIDLVKNPDLAAHPDIAAFILAQGMKQGSITGRSIGKYIDTNAGKVDFRNARRTINGIDPDQLAKIDKVLSGISLEEVQRLMANAGKGGATIPGQMNAGLSGQGQVTGLSFQQPNIASSTMPSGNIIPLDQFLAQGGYVDGGSTAPTQPGKPATPRNPAPELSRQGAVKIDEAQAQALRDSQLMASQAQRQANANSSWQRLNAEIEELRVTLQQQRGLEDTESRINSAQDQLTRDLSGLDRNEPRRQAKEAELSILTEYRDKNRDLLRQRDEIAAAVGMSKQGIKQFTEFVNNPPPDATPEQVELARRQIPKFQANVPKLEELLAKIDSVVAQQEGVRDKKLAFARETAQLAERDRSFKVAAEIDEASAQKLEKRIADIKDFQRDNPGDLSLGDPIELQGQLDMMRQALKLKQEIKDLEDRERTGALKPEEKSKLEGLKKELGTMDVSAINKRVARETEERDALLRTRATEDKQSSFERNKAASENQIKEIERFQEANPFDLSQGDPIEMRKNLAIDEENLKFEASRNQLDELLRTKRISKEKYDADMAAEEKRHMTTIANINTEAEAEKTKRNVAKGDYDFENKQRAFEDKKKVTDAKVESLSLDGRDFEAKQLQQSIIKEGQSLELEAQIRSLEKLAQTNPEVRAQLEATKAQLEELNQVKLDNLDAEWDKVMKDRAIAVEGRMVDSRAGLLEAQASSMANKGMGWDARQLQKEAAIIKQNFNFKQQTADLESFIKAQGLAADQAAVLRQELQNLGSIQMQGIEDQFSPWNDVLGSMTGGFKTFFSDVLSGSKSLKDAFNGLVDSILGSLANLAAEWLTNQIFGEIFGLGKSGQSGGDFMAGSLNGGKEEATPMNNIVPFGLGGGGMGAGSSPLNPSFVSVVGGGLGDAFTGANQFGFGQPMFGGSGGGTNFVDALFGNTFSLGGGSPLPVDMVAADTSIFDSLLGGFTSILGGGGSAMGGISSIISGLFGGGGGGGGTNFISALTSIFGFHNGGKPGIDGVATKIPNYAKGNLTKGVEQAMQREKVQSGGRKPMLAVLNTDELVLSAEQTKRFEQLGGTRILNFAKGSSKVSQGSFAQAVGEKTSSTVSVNAPISVTNQGEGGGRIDERKAQTVIDARIRQIVTQESRPGGVLYGKR